MSVAPDEIFDAELEARRQAERAMRLLSRPGAVIEARGPGYGVRLGASRRRCGKRASGAFRLWWKGCADASSPWDAPTKPRC